MSKASLSIIIPVLNEAQVLAQNLTNFKALQDLSTEVIFVDGGSTDATLSILHDNEFNVLSSASGRATQMNFAARQAKGKYLLFLHADTVLPENFEYLKADFMQYPWGFFCLRLSHSGWPYRCVAKGINFRSNLFNVATGDQTIFVESSLFFQLNGFRDIELMEDIELTRRLKKYSKPYIVNDCVMTSSRRWESRGVIRTAMLMWFLQLAFKVGVSSKRIKAWYQ